MAMTNAERQKKFKERLDLEIRRGRQFDHICDSIDEVYGELVEIRSMLNSIVDFMDVERKFIAKGSMSDSEIVQFFNHLKGKR